ncbi:MAG TPA: M35 family metallo-endopeptidase, partial [Roseiarcus sp.]
IYTDSVSERGTNANANTEAFFWGDSLNVVYIEEEFFGNGNTLTGITNWTRILIHEITHMVLSTKDHAYEHQAMAPAVLGSAKCLENADSWAWFCADCGGALTDGQVKNALARR